MRVIQHIKLLNKDGKTIKHIDIPFHWVIDKRKGLKTFEPTKDAKYIINQFDGWESVSFNNREQDTTWRSCADCQGIPF